MFVLSLFKILFKVLICSPEYIKIIPSEGLPVPSNKCMKGDLIVHFQIAFPSYIPKSIRKKLSEVLDEIEEAAEKNPQLCIVEKCD